MDKTLAMATAHSNLANVDKWTTVATIGAMGSLLLLIWLKRSGHISRSDFVRMIGIPICLTVAVLIDITVTRKIRPSHEYARHGLVGVVSVMLTGFLGYAFLTKESRGRGSTISISLSTEKRLSTLSKPSCGALAGDVLQCTDKLMECKDTGADMVASLATAIPKNAKSFGQNGKVCLNNTTLETNTYDSSTDEEGFADAAMRYCYRGASFFGVDGNKGVFNCSFPIRGSEAMTLLCPPDPCPLPRIQKELKLPPLMGDQIYQQRQEVKRERSASLHEPHMAEAEMEHLKPESHQLLPETATAINEVETTAVEPRPQQPQPSQDILVGEVVSREVPVTETREPPHRSNFAKAVSEQAKLPTREDRDDQHYLPHSATSVVEMDRTHDTDADSGAPRPDMPKNEKLSTDAKGDVEDVSQPHFTEVQSLPPSLAPMGSLPAVASRTGDDQEKEQSLHAYDEPLPSVKELPVPTPPKRQDKDTLSNLDDGSISQGNYPESIASPGSSTDDKYHLDGPSSNAHSGPHLASLASPGSSGQSSPMIRASLYHGSIRHMKNANEDINVTKDILGIGSATSSPKTSPYGSASPASSLPISPKIRPKSQLGLQSVSSSGHYPPINPMPQTPITVAESYGSGESVLTENFETLFNDGATGAVPCGVMVDGEKGKEWIVQERMKKVIDIVDNTIVVPFSKEDIDSIYKVLAMSNRPISNDSTQYVVPPYQLSNEIEDNVIDRDGPKSEQNNDWEEDSTKDNIEQSDDAKEHELNISIKVHEIPSKMESSKGWFDNILPYFGGGEVKDSEKIMKEQGDEETNDKEESRAKIVEHKDKTFNKRLKEPHANDRHSQEQKRNQTDMEQHAIKDISKQKAYDCKPQSKKKASKLRQQSKERVKNVVTCMELDEDEPTELAPKSETEDEDIDIEAEVKMGESKRKALLGNAIVGITLSTFVTVTFGATIARYLFFHSWSEMFNFVAEMVRRTIHLLIRFTVAALEVIYFLSSFILGRSLSVSIILGGIGYGYYKLFVGKKTIITSLKSESERSHYKVPATYHDNKVKEGAHRLQAAKIQDHNVATKNPLEQTLGAGNEANALQKAIGKPSVHAKVVIDISESKAPAKETSMTVQGSDDILQVDEPTPTPKETEEQGMFEATAEFVGETVQAIAELSNAFVEHDTMEHIKITYERKIPKGNWKNFKSQQNSS
jgi:hypothetical protein